MEDALAAGERGRDRVVVEHVRLEQPQVRRGSVQLRQERESSPPLPSLCPPPLAIAAATHVPGRPRRLLSRPSEPRPRHRIAGPRPRFGGAFCRRSWFLVAGGREATTAGTARLLQQLPAGAAFPQDARRRPPCFAACEGGSTCSFRPRLHHDRKVFDALLARYHG